VALNRCSLTEKEGKEARDALLQLLYPNGLDASQLSRDTGLDRGATIPKILGEKAGSVQQVKLETFFKKLLRLVKRQVDQGKISQQDVDQYLRLHDLTHAYREIGEAEHVHLPSKLYTFDNPANHNIKKTVSTTGARLKTQKDKKDNQVSKVVDLLWHLDYEDQEAMFKTALKQQKQCAAFSISAPCDITQRWLLNRLVKQIPNRKNALVLPAINLSIHPMRHGLKKGKGNEEYPDCQEFWQDLSGFLKTQPQREHVLQQLCHADVHRPVILTIYNFQQFKTIQKWVVREFWEKLAQQVTETSKRTRDSRIILFLVDDCSPCVSSSHVVNLKSLKEISQDDLEEWLNSDRVKPWWKDKFGDNFANELFQDDADLEDWVWESPGNILDNMCFKFGLEGEILAIEESWKWAS
jgi:hypothetical protein